MSYKELPKSDDALVCQWFANLLLKECDARQLSLYQQGQAEPLLAYISDYIGDDDSCTKMRQSIAALNVLADPRLELAADYATLFLMDYKRSAMLYASHYLGEKKLYIGEVNKDIERLLDEYGLYIHEELNEPADHLGIILALISHAIEVKSDILPFLQSRVLSWLPELVERVKTIQTLTSFYQSALILLMDYLYALQKYYR